MDEITRATLCRKMVEVEQQIETTRQLILDTIGDRDAHEAANREFLTLFDVLDRIEKILNQENQQPFEETMTDDQEKEWTLEAFIQILKRQIREIEAERIKMYARTKTADDNGGIVHVVAELQSFRRILSELESELKGESTDEWKTL